MLESGKQTCPCACPTARSTSTAIISWHSSAISSGSGSANRLADLTGQVLAGDERFDHVVTPTPEGLARDAFFQEYGRTHPVDYEALSRIALYSQLSTWGLVAAEGAPADKKQWIREQKLPLINELIRRILS